ncbi:unnamed protein product [Lactuca saligna]|uniref:DUF7950 domain-containing protein n=1 Tax=Lactuca saligna TaxID=75948 RepID=A0AA36E557_LACSI|nr:unnamed protein product [Lactuca saligna]
MDGRGGCCIARCSSGGGGGRMSMSYGMSKVEKIMLKFRPIAPKPLAAGSGSSCSTMENSDGYGGTRRRKRKYVRVNGNKAKKDTSTVSKKRKASASLPSVVSGGGDAVVTLSLMPETPDRKEKSPARSSSTENQDLIISPSPIVVNCNKLAPIYSDGHVRGTEVAVTDHSVAMAKPLPLRSQAVSLVTMESVTEKWLNGDGLGFTDEARVMSMETDACPSFITNSCDMVVWTNKAYSEMTAGGVGDETVVVVKKYNLVAMPVSLPSFTCKVKVTWGTEKTSSSSNLTAPCDVWRLQYGGYAWRLDVKAALSLGR